MEAHFPRAHRKVFSLDRTLAIKRLREYFILALIAISIMKAEFG